MMTVDDVMTVWLWQVTIDDVVMNNIKNKCNSDKVKMYSRLSGKWGSMQVVKLVYQSHVLLGQGPSLTV